MLYTFSQADYAQRELEGYFANITENDAVVLWQDGVLLAIKYPHCFEQCPAECLLCIRESETLLGKPRSAPMRVCSGKQGLWFPR